MKALDKCVLLALGALGVTYLLFTVQNAEVSRQSRQDLIEGINDRLTRYTYRPSQALKRRAFRVNDLCQRNPELRSYMPKHYTKAPNYLYESYLKHGKRSFLYCPVPKCGWSSWRTMFFETLYEGAKDYNSILNDMEKTGWLTPWKSVGMSKHLIFEGKKLADLHLQHRMIFVRDPYDRLVSAYKDKALRDDGLYTKREKSPCKWQKMKSPVLTFSQFIECILDNARTHSNNTMSSFSAGELLDMHWRPQSLLCNVCVINYNIIGHFDHMNADIAEALHLIDLKTQPSWSNVAGLKKPLAKYYKQLTVKQLRDLQLLYKYDFELFDFKKPAPVR